MTSAVAWNPAFSFQKPSVCLWKSQPRFQLHQQPEGRRRQRFPPHSSCLLCTSISCDGLPRVWDHNGGNGSKSTWWKRNAFLFFIYLFFVSHGSERERVCVWRRRYVTDPRPVPWVRKGRRHPGPFKVMTALGWELRRIEWGWGVGGALVWESPFITFSLSLFFFWFLYCFACAPSFDCSSSGALFPLPFITTGCLRMAQRGKSAPGSLCDTVMRGDVVIQQFLPKGHICSLSFCSPYLSESLFIYRGCTLQSLPGHQRVVATHSA